MRAKKTTTLRGLAFVGTLGLLQGCGGSGATTTDSGAETSPSMSVEAGKLDSTALQPPPSQDSGMNLQLGGGDSGATGDSGRSNEAGGSGGDGSVTSEASSSLDTGVPDSPAPRDAAKHGDASAGDAGQHREGGSDTGNSHDSGSHRDAGVDSGTCDPVKQTGCPTNEECTLGNGNLPVCGPSGTKTVGEICANNCVAGDLCSTDSPNGVFTCQEFCATDADCKQPAVGPAGNTPHCIISLEDASELLCSVPCNPVTAAGPSDCQTGQTCSYSGTDTIPEVTSCGTGGAGVNGTSCMAPEDCAGGFACISGAAGTSACRQVCRARQNADCTAAGYACDELPGATMYGICCPAAGC